jgi:hypothetical protein
MKYVCHWENDNLLDRRTEEGSDVRMMLVYRFELSSWRFPALHCLAFRDAPARSSVVPCFSVTSPKYSRGFLCSINPLRHPLHFIVRPFVSWPHSPILVKTLWIVSLARFQINLQFAGYSLSFKGQTGRCNRDRLSANDPNTRALFLSRCNASQKKSTYSDWNDFPEALGI